MSMEYHGQNPSKKKKEPAQITPGVSGIAMRAKHKQKKKEK